MRILIFRGKLTRTIITIGVKFFKVLHLVGKMNFRQLAFHDHQEVFFITSAAILSGFALRPDSTFLPIVATLSLLLVYSPFLFRHENNYISRIALTTTSLAVGTSLPRLRASQEALSTPGASIAALLSSSLLLSSFTVSALYVSTKISTRLASPLSQATIFPAVWATLWCTISYISPVGHLSTWSVADNADAYGWIAPYLGPAAKDWIVGAWAIVVSQTVGRWYIGSEDEDLLDVHANQRNARHNNSAGTKVIAFFLVFLTIPSFIFPNLPLPISAIDKSTPLTVGCVLPTFQRYNNHVLTLDDYIRESDKLRSFGARIILWPEGAVVFHSDTERQDAFKEITERITGPYIGVSFEETIGDPADPTGRKSSTRTGLAILSHRSAEPHQIYYKRHLVPVAESYRLRHSTLPPSIFEASIPRPKEIPKDQWGGNTRPVQLTSSICLDFANPTPFAELEERPALILAPARTWDPTVGNAMWLQARQRANELDSMVLWCDGGEGGVSGVGGGVFEDVTQVGPGSFVRTIGVQYPFDSRRSLFAVFGDSFLIFSWILVIAPGLVSRGNILQSIRHGGRTGMAYIRRLRGGEARPLIQL